MMTKFFNGHPLSQFLDGRIREAVASVSEVDEDEVRASAPDVAQHITEQFDLVPLELDSEKPQTTSFEGVVEHRDDFSGSRFQVPAVGVRATAKLSGPVGLMRYRTSGSVGSGLPEGDIPFSGSKELSIEVLTTDPDPDPVKVKTAIRAQFALFQSYIAFVNADVEHWRPHLAEAVRHAVSERAARLRSADQLIGGLNFDE